MSELSEFALVFLLDAGDFLGEHIDFLVPEFLPGCVRLWLLVALQRLIEEDLVHKGVRLGELLDEGTDFV